MDFDYTVCTSLSKWQEVAKNAGKVAAKCHALADKGYDAAIVTWSMDKEITGLVSSRGAFLDEVAAFARAYAQQVTLDWSAFAAAYRSGTPLY